MFDTSTLLISNASFRFADFAGTDWRQTATACVPPAASPTRTTRLTSSHYPKTSKTRATDYLTPSSNHFTHLRIIRIKKERRHKEHQKKQRSSENRLHLADVRVVQKNLVFVVGLSQRLADVEVLKKNEYFGRFGKILKVVINQSPQYAGSQVNLDFFLFIYSENFLILFNNKKIIVKKLSQECFVLGRRPW